MGSDLFLLSAIALAVGLHTILAPARRLRRRLRKACKFAIADLPENTLGRVVGHVRLLDEPLTAPLSGRTCVYYIARVKAGSEGEGRILVDEHAGVSFVIEDNTGRAIVVPTAAQVFLVFDHEGDTRNATYATREQDALLSRHGHSSKGFMGAKPMLFEEGVIEVGERVGVLGSGIRDLDPERGPPAGYRDAPATLLRLTSSARYPLIISDNPDDLG